MPTDADIDSAIDEGAGEVVEAAPVAAQPSYTLDTSGLDQKIADGVARAMRETFAEARRQQQSPIEDPSLRELSISEDDDEEVRFNKRLHNSQIPLRREMAEFRQFGLSKLTDLTSRSAAAELPYYATYKGEIEAQLSQLDPALRADMNTIRLVHNDVVARHIEEIADKRAEEKARTALLSTKMPKPGSSGRGVGNDTNSSTSLQPSDLFDTEQVRMIEEKGGPDAFAKRVSGGKFKSWDEYAAKAKALSDRPRAEGRPIIPFARYDGKKKA